MNNSITLVGRVGQSPQLKQFKDSGTKVAKFSLAVKDYSPNDQEKTMWIDIDAWNGTGERVIATITKGREVIVTGRLCLTQYEKQVDGNPVQVTKPFVRLLSFHLCGGKPKSDAPSESTSTNRG